VPVILVIQEAEIRRLMVQSQPRQILRPYLEKIHHKKSTGRMAQGVGPEFKPSTKKKKRKKKKNLKKEEEEKEKLTFIMLALQEALGWEAIGQEDLNLRPTLGKNERLDLKITKSKKQLGVGLKW
jgi:hypothetical protein